MTDILVPENHKAVMLVSKLTGHSIKDSKELKWNDLSQPIAIQEKMLESSENDFKYLLGSSVEERALIQQWLSYGYHTVYPASSDLGAQKSYSKFLNDQLSNNTFIAGGYRASLADYVLYIHVQPYMKKLQSKRMLELNYLTRWFDLIQHDDLMRQHSGLDLVEIEI